MMKGEDWSRGLPSSRFLARKPSRRQKSQVSTNLSSLARKVLARPKNQGHLKTRQRILARSSLLRPRNPGRPKTRRPRAKERRDSIRQRREAKREGRSWAREPRRVPHSLSPLLVLGRRRLGAAVLHLEFQELVLQDSQFLALLKQPLIMLQAKSRLGRVVKLLSMFSFE